MTVYFIGAGPGAADLITVRGQRLLSRCPVCLYAGSIMPDDLLALCPPDARVVDTGPLTLDAIIDEIAAGDCGRIGCGAAAFGRSVSLQRARRTVQASRCARHRIRDRARRTGFRGGRGGARPGTDRARGRADRHADARRDAVDGDAGRRRPRHVVDAGRDAGAASGSRPGRCDRPAAARRRIPRRNALCGGRIRQLATGAGGAVHAWRTSQPRCMRRTSPEPR